MYLHLIKLGWRLLPFTLLWAVGPLLLFAGIVTVSSNSANPPVDLSLRQLEDATFSPPKWASVKDGWIPWGDSFAWTKYRVKKDGTQTPVSKEFYVPLVSAERKAEWRSGGRHGRCVLLRFSEEEAKAKFPSLLTGVSPEPWTQYPVTFDPRLPGSDGEREAAERLELMGFTGVLIADAGAQEFRETGAPAICVTGLAALVGGFFWVRKRKRSAQAGAGLIAAAAGGLSAGLAGGVSLAVSQAFERARDRIGS